MTTAGVLFVTAAGAAPRIAARVASTPWLTLVGGDGDARFAAVLEAEGGAELERLSALLLAEHPEILGVFPTFVAED